MSVVELYVGNHTFVTFAKFSEKLTFVTLMICTRSCARIRGNITNVSFLESFASALNE